MFNSKRLFSTVALTTVAFVLASCSGTPEAKLYLNSAQYLNPDINGRPSPVVLSVYELKSAYSFKQASYYALSSNLAKTLGPNLIDKQTIEIRPNSSKTFTQDMSPNTHYIGLIAGYRNIDQSTWRKVIPVTPGKKTIKINVTLESQGLVATIAK